VRFYEHEERRRRRTAVLLCLLAASVAGTILGTYLAFALLLGWTGLAHPFSWWQPRLFAWTGIGTSVLILLGTVHMYRVLSLGGGALARRLGGKEVPADPGEGPEKRLRNVVEEVAIASGIPVPEILVLEREGGINAFAAGLRPDDAAIAVTRGSLALLDRDELQGVVAHELSHVRNGDTRLNAQLLAVLHGVLLVGETGREMVDLAFTRTGERGGRPPVLLAIPGAVLAGVGSLGLLFARMLKSAACRQREFLADASAVRMTRNPRGLAGALKKIGGLEAGSRLLGPRAEEVSHMSFGQAVPRSLFGTLSTHPPVRDRILAIEPAFSGRFPKVEPLPLPPEEKAPLVPSKPRPEPATFRAAEFVRAEAGPRPEQLAFARSLLESIPPEVAAAARDTHGARSLACALLLDPDAEVRRRQVATLESLLDRETVRHALDLHPKVASLGSAARLPLLDLALPALRKMTGSEFAKFAPALEGLSRADGRTDLFELALGAVLERRLGRSHGPVTRRPVQFYALTGLLPDVRILLSALSRAGSADGGEAESSFAAGVSRLTEADLVPASREECGADALAHSLDRIARSVPRIRERVLDACAFAAARDGQLTGEEADLLRAVAAAVDLPLPPHVRT
jgi:Zn-dependent protease with chaperone function